VRFEPGASIPAHRHLQTEQCLVIEGDVEHDGNEYGPGDFTWAEAGSIDPTLTSRNGSLVLIIGGKETEKVL
jgi:anti-sigma factor ChrR (cupin superfamily)